MLSRWNRGFSIQATVAIAVLAAVAPATFAAVQNSVQVTITPTTAGGTGPYDVTNSGTGTLDLSHSATGGLNSTGNASAHVEYGAVALTGSASGSIDARAKGIFRDNFTITSPSAPTDTVGHLTFYIKVQGSLDAPAGLSATTWTLDADVGSGFGIHSTDTFGSPDSANPGDVGDPFAVYSSVITFQFGEAISLDVEFSGLASARPGNDSPPPPPAGAADFSLAPGIYWEGIDFINVSGNDVNDVAQTSDSGTNWLIAYVPSTPAPEPATALILLSSLPWVLSRRTRRAAKRT